MKKKEKTFARKLKIMTLSMSLIALSLIILALPVSLAVATASIYATTQMSQGPPPTPTPQISPTIGEYKEQEPMGTMGSLSVTSEPSRASVYLNGGYYIGRTPLEQKDVRRGHYVMKLTKDGYETDFVNIYVVPGKTLEVKKRVLSPIPTGNISATSEPSEAEVYLDGMSIGTTPVAFNASAGLHVISFVKEDYETYSTDTSIKPGETVVVKGVLSSILSGNIYATSDPDEADVYLDDKYVGTTPVVFNASAGLHVISFVKEDYESYSTGTSVKSGETVNVSGVLSQSYVESQSYVGDVLLLVVLIIPIILILFFYYLLKRVHKQEKK